MKKLLSFLMVSTSLAATQAQASSEDAKIETVKSLYQEAREEALYGNNDSEFTILYSYAREELRDKIDLFEASEKNVTDYSSDFYGALNECGELGYYSLRLTAGNSYGLKEVKNFDFKLLRNGNVRAIMHVTGDAYVDTFGESTAYKDFSVECRGNDCKITDIVDIHGFSETNGIKDACS